MPQINPNFDEVNPYVRIYHTESGDIEVKRNADGKWGTYNNCIFTGFEKANFKCLGSEYGYIMNFEKCTNSTVTGSPKSDLFNLTDCKNMYVDGKGGKHDEIFEQNSDFPMGKGFFHNFSNLKFTNIEEARLEKGCLDRGELYNTYKTKE